MEFSADETIEEEISNLFNSYLDEAKLHDAGCSNQIIPVQSFEEAVNRALQFVNQNKNLSQSGKDTGVNYETPTELKTKIITQKFNSKIHLISGVSDNDAQNGYLKNNKIHKSLDGIGIFHLMQHIKHWNNYYKHKIKNNNTYKKQLLKYGITETNQPIKNMLLFVKYAIDVGGCQNQQKRKENGEYMVAILFDGWRIVFGYDDTYRGKNNENDFTYLETMYYVGNNNSNNYIQNRNQNNDYEKLIKSQSHSDYDKIKAFDDKLKLQNKKEE